MVFISNVVPGFERKDIETHLGLSNDDQILFFKFSMIDKRDIEKALDQGYSIAYSVKTLEGFNLKQIAAIIEENKQMQIQLDRMKEYFMMASLELTKLKSSSTVEESKEEELNKRLHHIMSENDKLKSLVKSHLESNPDSKFSQGTSLDSVNATQEYSKNKPGYFAGSNPQQSSQPKDSNSGGQWRKKYGEKNR